MLHEPAYGAYAAALVLGILVINVEVGGTARPEYKMNYVVLRPCEAPSPRLHKCDVM